MALGHVEALERKIAEMQAMAHALRHLAEHCHGDERPDCPILDDLAQMAVPRPARRRAARGPAVVRGRPELRT